MTTPEVTCISCDRRVRCAVVSDGTVYRPLAWEYPDATRPMGGICAVCQTQMYACSDCGEDSRIGREGME